MDLGTRAGSLRLLSRPQVLERTGRGRAGVRTIHWSSTGATGRATSTPVATEPTPATCQMLKFPDMKPADRSITDRRGAVRERRSTAGNCGTCCLPRRSACVHSGGRGGSAVQSNRQSGVHRGLCIVGLERIGLVVHPCEAVGRASLARGRSDDDHLLYGWR